MGLGLGAVKFFVCSSTDSPRYAGKALGFLMWNGGRSVG